MRLGCCGGIEQAEAMKAAGFDYVEVNVQSVLKGEQPDGEWTASAPAPVAVALPIAAANCLVPGHLPIVGPQRDPGKLRVYMQRVTERAKRLGIEHLVFGSGGARQRPDGVGEATAMEHLVEFGKIAGEAAEPHGVTIVVEHLNRGETNTINTLEQMAELIERVNHPRVRALVDSYHFGLEREALESVTSLGESLRHVHVAEPIDRLQPGGHGPNAGDKAFDFVSFFATLRAMGYDGGVSIEAKWTAPIDQAGAACVELLRHAWSRAGQAAAAPK